jgi:hypothetical protein
MLLNKGVVSFGLAALTIGLVSTVSAQTVPHEFYHEKSLPISDQGDIFIHTYSLDFTKTSLNPSLNYETFPNPRNTSSIVKFFPHRLVAAASPGACFEITSEGPAGADPIISVQNHAGVWAWLADDNQGGGQFRARIYIKPVGQYEFRISQYTPGNNNDQLGIRVRKIKANSGSAINATSCRLSGVPFWQNDLNSGNPYNPS